MGESVPFKKEMSVGVNILECPILTRPGLFGHPSGPTWPRTRLDISGQVGTLLKLILDICGQGILTSRCFTNLCFHPQQLCAQSTKFI